MSQTKISSFFVISRIESKDENEESMQEGGRNGSATSNSQTIGTKPEDKYACNINSDGYCIFTGNQHNSGLSPNTNNIVNRNGEFLFYINEAVSLQRKHDEK